MNANPIDELVLEVRQDNSLQATLKCEGEIEPPVEEPAILQKDRETIRDSVGLLKRKELDGKADLLIRLGEDLYTALFPMKIGSLFERALRDVQKANIPDKTTTRSLRVVFDVHPESTVARDSWPLELLRYHDQEKWLAAATDITLARLIKTEGSPIKVEKTPLRVLLVASLPTSSNLRGVITADLVKAIAKVSTRGAAGQGNPLEVKVLGCIPEGEQIGGIDYPGHHATWQALQEMAEQGWQPQVLHFIGHGELSGSHGQVTLEGENGTEFSVSAEDLYDSLLQEWGPLVVLLQACENAREGTEAALVKVADYLAGHGIPAAVAMQLSVTNNQATLFAKGFYEALVQGEDIEKAVSIGRQSILKSTLSHSPAFGASVLFAYHPPIALIVKRGGGQALSFTLSPIEKLQGYVNESKLDQDKYIDNFKSMVSKCNIVCASLDDSAKNEGERAIADFWDCFGLGWRELKKLSDEDLSEEFFNDLRSKWENTVWDEASKCLNRLRNPKLLSGQRKMGLVSDQDSMPISGSRSKEMSSPFSTQSQPEIQPSGKSPKKELK